MSGSANKFVSAGPAIELIMPGSAKKFVSTGPAECRVVTRKGEHMVVAVQRFDLVIVRRALDTI